MPEIHWCIWVFWRQSVCLIIFIHLPTLHNRNVKTGLFIFLPPNSSTFFPAQCYNSYQQAFCCRIYFFKYALKNKSKASFLAVVILFCWLSWFKPIDFRVKRADSLDEINIYSGFVKSHFFVSLWLNLIPLYLCGYV